MKKILVLTGVLLATAAAFSDEAPFVSPTPGVDVVLGVRSFPRETDSSSTFQTLVLRPHLTWDDWYIQLDLPLNYQIVDSDGFSVSLREADWIPTGKRTYLDVYLPRIALIQFGEPGADVFFQVGAINELTLGNGFVVDRYSNTLFAPGHTQTGANISLRGPLFGLPSGGFDAIIGNLAALDVIAGRVHWALFEFSGHPLFSTMEVGTTLAADRDPWYLATRNPAENNPFVDGAPPGNKPDDAATTWGIDVKIPVVRSPEFQAAVYGDYIVQNQRSGSMLGVEASFADRLLLRGEAQLVQDGVVPRYFGALYDSRRPEIYRVWNGEIAKPGGFGWLGGAGLVSRDNRFAIHTSVAGHPGGGDDDTAQQVHASFQYHGTIEIEARYDTFGVTSLADFANLKNTRVGVHAAIRSEAVAVALSYNVVHDPLQPGDPWAVFAGLETRISY